MGLHERRRKGSYLGRWWESYLLRDGGATVRDKTQRDLPRRDREKAT
jgi:hypothetical protein